MNLLRCRISLIRKAVHVYGHEHVNVNVDVDALVNVDVDLNVLVDGFWRLNRADTIYPHVRHLHRSIRAPNRGICAAWRPTH